MYIHNVHDVLCLPHKRLVLGLGANCTVNAMVNISKCIGMLQEVTSTIDKQLQITPEQTHHARQHTDEDERLILKEIVYKSHVFEYVPGRQRTQLILHFLAAFYTPWIQTNTFLGFRSRRIKLLPNKSTKKFFYNDTLIRYNLKFFILILFLNVTFNPYYYDEIRTDCDVIIMCYSHVSYEC